MSLQNEAVVIAVKVGKQVPRWRYFVDRKRSDGAGISRCTTLAAARIYNPVNPAFKKDARWLIAQGFSIQAVALTQKELVVNL